MSRKQPENPDPSKPFPPEVDKQSGLPERTMRLGKEETKVTVQTRQYKLITPLFGGGVEPGENDPDNLIRGSEIRGQLRFWWRAIRGWQSNGDIKKLKQLEDKIWGAASNIERKTGEDEKEKKQDVNRKKRWKGVVQIEVCNAQKAENEQREIELPVYAAFPLTDQDGSMQTKSIKTPHKGVSLGVHFEMKISFQSIFDLEIEAALWAWETFGGVGARTRRGFGAIQLTHMDMVPNRDLPSENRRGAQSWFDNKFKKYTGTGQYPDDVPHLNVTTSLVILVPANNVMWTWHELINRLQKFRRTPPREYTGGKRQGWPEAKAIKEIVASPEEYDSTNYVNSFPRSALGLPINFYFGEDEKRHKTPGDNEALGKVYLEGAVEKKDRLASPLILRPLTCQTGKTIGLAVVLEGSKVPPEGISLVKREEDNPGKRLLHPESIHPEAILPIGQERILSAFLQYIDTNYGK